MASYKTILILVIAFAAIFAVSSAEERVKKDVLLNPYGAYPYGAYPYAAAGYAHYPYALSYADDGSYFPGKYDPYY